MKEASVSVNGGEWHAGPPVLPCPFCGERTDIQVSDDGVRFPVLTCNNCGAEMQGTSVQNAADKWNTRTPAA